MLREDRIRKAKQMIVASTHVTFDQAWKIEHIDYSEREKLVDELNKQIERVAKFLGVPVSAFVFDDESED